MQLPCGQCIGCRLERSRQWAIRCVHESKLHEENCFVTLTYDNEHVPSDFSLDKTEHQRFLKKLRKKFADKKIRYMLCGEYGEQFERPHYHACLFGIDFADKKLYSINNGNKLYTSETLNKIWGLGQCWIGDVTFESAAYVARYICKKVTGKNAEEHYKKTDMRTGEIITIEPEFIRMSLKPGIGKDWMEKWTDDIYPSDEIIIRGKKMKPPRYYDKVFETKEQEKMEKIKNEREKKRRENWKENTTKRLQTRKTVKEAQVKQLKRKYEDEN